MKKANFRVAKRESGTTWFAAKALAFASLCAFGMQPMVASAQAKLPITVQQGNGATLGTSSNGTSVVNIAAPNRAGVSNNVFGQYNVGTSGVILNNSGRAVQTQIGGTVQGNAALGNGNANLIVMQATGGSATRMLGATEVAGKGANVVVANPAGITCSGCSFLNAPRVTLTTGTPVMDQNGALSGIYVQNGQITIDGKGLNAKDSAVDLISRAMTINGAVQGKSIDAIAGVNQVDYATKSIHAVNGSYSGAEVAIDVQALGSMYGDGAVRLIANEAGVGVRDNGKISSLNGDISISSKGDITIGAPGQISSASSVALNGVNVLNNGKLASDSVRVEAARNIDNSGSVEGRNVTITAGDTLTSSGKLDASNGLFLTGSRKANLDGGNATSRGGLYVSGNTVTNRNGKMLAAGELSIDANTVDNTKGSIKSNGVVNVNAKTLLNDGGEIAGAKGTNLPGQGGQQPTPDQGGQQPAPDQGGQQPVPDQGGQHPAPDQGPTPVDPHAGEMATLITPGGEMPVSFEDLHRLPDLVNVGGNRYVPRQFLAMLGYDEKGNIAPVNPDHGSASSDPYGGAMGTLITKDGEVKVSLLDLNRMPDLVDLGQGHFVPRESMNMIARDEKGYFIR